MPANHATPSYLVRKSRIAGSGVFAARAIRKGERILEYTGERISQEVANARYDDERQDHAHVVLFTVDEDTVIDGGAGGGDARFVNHSCEPNCEAVQQRRRIFIRALRAIKPGEELCYDYGLERAGKWQPEWDMLYACRCGAANCRGTMLAPVKGRRVATRSVNAPQSVKRLDAEKFGAACRAVLDVVPVKGNGMTWRELHEAAVPLLPEEHWPGGSKALWWLKTAQLDLEARGLLTRLPGKPLRWRRT